MSTPLGVWLWPSAGALAASSDGAEVDAVFHYRKAFAWLTNLAPADAELADQWKTVPLGRDVEALLRRASPTLASWRDGASLVKCAWDDVISNESLTRDHLDFRNLRVARLALLRSRLLFAQGQDEGALDDLFAVVRFARHVGTSGVLIAQLYRSGFEVAAITRIALVLPRLSEAVRKSLPARIRALPSPCPWFEIMRRESRFILENSRRSEEDIFAPRKPRAETAVDEYLNRFPEKIRAFTNGDRSRWRVLINEAPPLLTELAEILDQPRNEYKPRLDDFTARMNRVNPLVASVIDNAEGARFAFDRTHVLWTMLEAALTKLNLGSEAFLAIRDPYGTGPFAYRALEHGFELRSAFSMKDQPATVLMVGEE